MYNEFFGFSDKPFNVTPDPRFLFLSQGHREALASLIYGIQERRGFIVMIGEVGTGKTTLINALCERLDIRTKVACIVNNDLSFEDILHQILIELGLAKVDELLPKSVALKRLHAFASDQLAAAGNVALIIDEAQNLDSKTLENLRLLSNMETKQHKLLQIVLSGQPELDDILSRHELRQLAQRISMKRYIKPLRKIEVQDYITHHLNLVGYDQAALFDSKALELVWDYSQGVPRKINNLCDNALLIAYALDQKKIKAPVVQETITDLGSPSNSMLQLSEHQEPSSPEPAPAELKPAARSRTGNRMLTAAAIVLALFAGAGGLSLWQSSTNPDQSAATASSPQELERQAAEDEKPAQRRSQTASLSQAEASTAETTADHALPAGAPTGASQTAPSAPAASQERKPDRVSQTEVSQLVRTAPKTGTTEQLQTSSKAVATASGKAQRDAASVSESAPQGAAAEPNTPQPETTNKPDHVQEVVIQEGDTLFQLIEHRYGDYEQALPVVLEHNPEISNPNRIETGQVLKLPSLHQSRTLGDESS